ncbi:hypothetical protein [Dyella agri]|uniref:Uncharacterized protein n=1 Tax=Dyella agri TaxID=1926869 RepID=A0ABW8KEE2_9GAMM
MPKIYASYLGKISGKRISREGFNANERARGNRRAPSINIKKYAPKLGELMDGLKLESRSAYACAEAQALAKLLGAINNFGLDFSQIEFSRPTSDSGLLLWSPCQNCSSWMSLKSGGGSTGIYKIKDEVVAQLHPKESPRFSINIDSKTEFPDLPSK